VGNELVVYDEETKEAHCLKPLAAQVLTHSDGSRNLAQLAALVSAELGESVDVPRVRDAVEQLEERDLIVHSPRRGISRRDMLRRSAVAGVGALSVPLITSVMAPPAFAATSASCAALLCCSCATTSIGNKKDCCTGPGTVNCVCVNAVYTCSSCGVVSQSVKVCKPNQNAAPSDTFCQTVNSAPAGSPPNGGYPSCDTCCQNAAAFGGGGNGGACTSALYDQNNAADICNYQQGPPDSASGSPAFVNTCQ
jgi:hypothetical protein